MQPYQEASDEFTKQSYRPFEAAGAVGGAGIKTAISGKIMSMLNKYIPANLAIKGLNKIDPRLGKFLSLGQEMGYSEDELKGFIENKVTENPSENKQPKENRNIIEQYSPELNEFLKEQIGSGRKPIEAAAIAQNDKRFSSIIQKLSNDHKTPWSSIIESVFGQGQIAQQSQSQEQGNEIDDNQLLAAFQNILKM